MISGSRETALVMAGFHKSLMAALDSRREAARGLNEPFGGPVERPSAL
jgi:hypothetical protein